MDGEAESKIVMAGCMGACGRGGSWNRGVRLVLDGASYAVTAREEHRTDV
jgi:hypothetical protein